MKSILISLFTLSYACALTIYNVSLDSEWNNFKQIHQKAYKTKEEESLRRIIWEKHLSYINQHNREANDGKHTFVLSMNKFGDMTNQEFKNFTRGLLSRQKLSNDKKNSYISSKSTIPSSVDWRTSGYVTSVKNQLQCGSCYAFTAIAALEGQHAKQSGKLVDLSAQEILDCSSKEGNYGCNGGYMDSVFEYVKDNKGIDSEASYPYEGQDGKCRFKPENVVATCSGYVDIQAGNEDDLTDAIANIGPISAAMDASHSSFQFYKSGIYYEPACSSTEVDHTAAIVGYGAQDSNKFYIVKNSWGTDWGNEGYILMSRGRNNNCGIATLTSYPLV